MLANATDKMNEFTALVVDSDRLVEEPEATPKLNGMVHDFLYNMKKDDNGEFLNLTKNWQIIDDFGKQFIREYLIGHYGNETDKVDISDNCNEDNVVGGICSLPFEVYYSKQMNESVSWAVKKLTVST